MKKVKESSGLISALSIITIFLAILGYATATYATKESCEIANKLILSNKQDINKLETKSKNIGAIVCGIAIDLQLPTARKECNTIISN